MWTIFRCFPSLCPDSIPGATNYCLKYIFLCPQYNDGTRLFWSPDKDNVSISNAFSPCPCVSPLGDCAVSFGLDLYQCLFWEGTKNVTRWWLHSFKLSGSFFPCHLRHPSQLSCSSSYILYVKRRESHDNVVFKFMTLTLVCLTVSYVVHIRKCLP